MVKRNNNKTLPERSEITPRIPLAYSEIVTDDNGLDYERRPPWTKLDKQFHLVFSEDSPLTRDERNEQFSRHNVDRMKLDPYYKEYIKQFNPTSELPSLPSSEHENFIW